MDEDISPEDWKVREVYAVFGLAMYWAQVLEHGLVNLIVWSGVGDGTYDSAELADAAFEDLFRKTMGSIKKTLLERRNDLAHLEDLLVRALRLRNFLAHNYFRERAAAFTNDETRASMIVELHDAVAFFRKVDEKLEPLTHAVIRARGLDGKLPELLEEVAQAGYGQALPGLTPTD